MTADPARAAFARLVDALNAPRDEALQAAAFAADIDIERYQPGPRGEAALAQRLRGAAEVARWFARTPPISQFRLAGEPAREPDGRWLIEYAISAGDFHNGGVWCARLADDGRIVALAHHPFALRAPA